MSNNYYLRNARRLPRFDDEESVHIGLSARGWAFALHVIPEEGLNSLEDWRARYRDSDSEIVDDYGRLLTASEMDEIITTENIAQDGRLSRVSVDGSRCVGNGDGPWQLFAGAFC